MATTITIAEALALGRDALPLSASPALDARLLLEHVLEKEHSYLVTFGDQTLTLVEAATFQTLINRAAQLEPIPYITGRAPFYGLEFSVTPAVLIPRPETELLLEAALAWVDQGVVPGRELVVVDVGTGSGCIAILLARHLAEARINAVDSSPAALVVARANAEALGVAGTVRFYLGSLLNPLPDPPDLIVANLPYVADHEWATLEEGVRLYEPDISLRGGPDGLELIRSLLVQATKRLAPGGAIFLEIGWRQGSQTERLARDFFPKAQVNIRKDYGGHDRILSIVSQPNTVQSK
jgi:release factor glutamine methyltransferase